MQYYYELNNITINFNASDSTSILISIFSGFLTPKFKSIQAYYCDSNVTN
jgi:hypothetical protein